MILSALFFSLLVHAENRPSTAAPDNARVTASSGPESSVAVAVEKKNEAATPTLADGSSGGENKISVELPGTADHLSDRSSDHLAAGDSAGNLNAQSKKSEDQIPVRLDNSLKSANASSSPMSKAMAAAAIVCVLALGGYVMVGRYRRSQIGKNSAPEIKILRQHHLGPKKSLAIIRVAGESMLVGITDHNINMIKSLSLLDEDVPEEVPTQNFSQSLDQAGDRTFDGKFKVTHNPHATQHTQAQAVGQSQESRKSAPGPADEMEEYSISGIRDFVNQRLKNMRSLS